MCRGSQTLKANQVPSRVLSWERTIWNSLKGSSLLGKRVYQAREWEASGHGEGPIRRCAEYVGQETRRSWWRGAWDQLRRGLRLHAEECFYHGGFYHEDKNTCNTMSHHRIFQKEGMGFDIDLFFWKIMLILSYFIWNEIKYSCYFCCRDQTVHVKVPGKLRLYNKI